jgi:hypothetical protein
VTTAIRLIVLSAVLTIYIFEAYATRLFGLTLPYPLALFIWLVLPSIIGLLVFCYVLSRSPWPSQPLRRTKIAGVSLLLVSTCLYVASFFAINTFGS